MTTTLPATRALCTDRKPLDGGQPTLIELWMLEEHVEELVIVKDVVERGRRAALAMDHYRRHIIDAHLRHDTARLRRALDGAHKLTTQFIEWSQHVLDETLPRIETCYREGEAAYAEARR